MLAAINNFDQTLLFYIQSLIRGLFLDNLMINITALGDKGFIWIAIALLLMIDKSTRRIGLMAIFALLLSTIVGEGILKHLIQRPRIYVDYPGIQLLVQESTTYSFPSGHTTSSFATAYVLSKGLSKYSLLFWSIAGLIAFSRLYLMLHYPTDIIAGIVIGLLCGKITIHLFNSPKI